MDVVSKLKDQLQITDYELPLTDLNRNQIRGKLTNEGKKLSKACERFYIEQIFEPFCNLKRENELDKLHIYGVINKVFRYETYLDTTQKYTNALTRFRLSCHWLPIERVVIKIQWSQENSGFVLIVMVVSCTVCLSAIVQNC